MKNSIFGVSLFALSFLLLLFPPRAHAYFKTGEEILKEDGSIIFLMDYSFGNKEHEIDMPLMARDTDGTLPAMLSYQILSEDGQRIAGRAVGVVISGAQIGKNAEYVVPKGHGAAFRLAVVFTPDPALGAKKYRLQVTSLPFYFDHVQPLHLNPSELQYYTTAFATP